VFGNVVRSDIALGTHMQPRLKAILKGYGGHSVKGSASYFQMRSADYLERKDKN